MNQFTRTTQFLIPTALAQPEVDHLLRSILPAVHHEAHGESAEYFFLTREPANICTARLETNEHAVGISVQPKASYAADLTVALGPDRTAIAFLRQLLGREITVIRSKYSHFTVENESQVWTETVTGFDYVMLTINAADSSTLFTLANHVKDQLQQDAKITLLPESRSRYEMFVAQLVRPGEV